MFGIVAFVAFLIGFFVSHAYESPDGGSFWLFIGLMFVSLAVSFVNDRVSGRFR